jgi:Fic family protein
MFGRYRHLIGKEMSAEDWSQVFHVTLRQGTYLLKQGEELGWIERKGKGRYTEYFFSGANFKKTT